MLKNDIIIIFSIENEKIPLMIYLRNETLPVDNHNHDLRN